MKQILIGLVRLYRLLLSPWAGGQCRFYPTCSQYTIDALERHGAAAGTYLGAVRILRCQPWCRGGHAARRSPGRSRRPACGPLIVPG